MIPDLLQLPLFLGVSASDFDSILPLNALSISMSLLEKWRRHKYTTVTEASGGIVLIGAIIQFMHFSLFCRSQCYASFIPFSSFPHNVQPCFQYIYGSQMTKFLNMLIHSSSELS